MDRQRKEQAVSTTLREHLLEAFLVALPLLLLSLVSLYIAVEAANHPTTIKPLRHQVSEEISIDVTASSLLTSLTSDPRLLSLLLNPRDLVDMKKLHTGHEVRYCLVNYQHSSLLVSKQLRRTFATNERTAKLAQEAKLVSTLDHPCISKLVGVSWGRRWGGEPDISSFRAFFEFADKGSLRDYLHSSSIGPGWDTQKLDIAINIADALVYIHSFASPIVHQNLRAANILLTENMQAKLAGFEEAKRGALDHSNPFETQSEVEKQNTVGHWMAPEVIANFRDNGESADIFSFGVVLLEIEASLSDEYLWHIVQGEMQPTFHPTCPSALSDLILLCLRWDPSDRPSAAGVAYNLRRVHKEL